MKTKTQVEIMNKVYAHYDYVCEKYGSKYILGVFAYGSMNYGTYIEGRSDVDTKAIYVPDLDGALFSPAMSKELHIGDEHCELKDIREMFKMYKKQNINFTETLFTQFYTINPMYIDFWESIEDAREDIARYDITTAVKSIAGQTLHTIHQARLLDKNTAEYQKKASNIFRLKVFLNQYTGGRSYGYCIKPDDLTVSTILGIKQGKIPFIDELLDDCEQRIREMSEKEYAVGENIEPLNKLFERVAKDCILLCENYQGD